MMNEWMKILFSLSLSGTLIGILVLLIAKTFKKSFSKTWQYYILLIVVIRMLIPISPDKNLMNIINNKISYKNHIVINNENNIDDQNNINDLIELNNLVNVNGFNNINSKIDINNRINNNINNNQISSDQYNYFQDASENNNEAITAEADENPGINNHGQVKSLSFNLFINKLNNNLIYIWFLIAVLIFVKKITAYCNYIRYLKAGCQEIYDDLAITIYLNTCREMGIKKPLLIYTNSLSASAALTGIIKRFIILPSIELTEDELYFIFKHELMHYKRNDILYKWVLQITACIHWFNPFIYILVKKHDKLCELSCDEAVIKNINGQEQRSYGDMLLSVVKVNGTFTGNNIFVTLNQDSKLLKERLESIMSFTKNKRLTLGATLLITVGFIIGAVFTGVYSNIKSSSIETAEAAEILAVMDSSSVYSAANINQGIIKKYTDKWLNDYYKNWGYNDNDYDYNYDYSKINSGNSFNEDNFMELNKEAENLYGKFNLLSKIGVERYNLNLEKYINEFNNIYNEFNNKDRYYEKESLLYKLEEILFNIDSKIDEYEDTFYLFEEAQLKVLIRWYDYLRGYAEAIGSSLDIVEEEFVNLMNELININGESNRSSYIYEQINDLLVNAEDKLKKRYGKNYSSHYERYNSESVFHIINIKEEDAAGALSNGWYKKDEYYCKVLGPFYSSEQDYAFFDLKNDLNSNYELGTSIDTSLKYNSMCLTVYNNIANIYSKMDGSYYIYLKVKYIKNLNGNIYIPYSEKNSGLNDIVNYYDIPLIKIVNKADENFTKEINLSKIKINVNNANVKIVKASDEKLEYTYPEKCFKIKSSLEENELTITVDNLTKINDIWDHAICVIYIPDDNAYNIEIVSTNSGTHIQNVKGNINASINGSAFTAELVTDQKINIQGYNNSCTVIYPDLKNCSLFLSTNNSAVSLPLIMKDYVMNKFYKFEVGSRSTQIVMELSNSAVNIK